MHTIGEKRIRMLNPRNIKRPQFVIRHEIDENELHSLRDSIAASGVLQPLIVKKEKKGTYRLISGSRRLQAALLAGVRRVPCVVHSANDTTAILYSLTENLQSRELSFFDEARTIDYLINKKGLPISEVAANLGVTGTALFSKLQVLRLDSRLEQRIRASHLTEKHARALLRLPKEGRAEVLNTVISENLSIKETEKYIFSILNPPLAVENAKPQEKAVRKSAIGDPRLFSNSLTKLVDTLKEGGVKVNFRKSESDTHTEYKIRIKKDLSHKEEGLQMKIVQ
ncbi:MAG: ParB/RepB/Spo0J family partition protein [Clostridia bacterium]|nr:ParB/RepB/Spo0J family partition protein [Clostridia bacterium]